ncbi:hypothetical protein LEP1GSC052_0350 [Leptospira kmetyi serovar Malaysia str. Bejo-Iso9]|nr:hypothetical protein LEP1GSC052_0350 [Leptospira kmetyi serovar Malaysia str. Bejo-Iso9]
MNGNKATFETLFSQKFHKLDFKVYKTPLMEGNNSNVQFKSTR